MIALRITFPGGRYHATPWGRNVNEAAVAWPPEPWRILRALIAVWHRKLGGPGGPFPRQMMAELIDQLASEAPAFSLPQGAIHSHTRHYMPQRKAGNTSLVFDAFLRLPTGAELVVGWPSLDLGTDQAQLLAALAAGLGYLGRAESWVEVRLDMDWDGTPNCVRLDDDQDLPGSGDVLHVLHAMTADAYTGARTTLLEQVAERAVAEKRLKTRRSPPTEKALRKRSDEAKREAEAGTLPPNLLEALSLETGQLQAAGWPRPPASQEVSYFRAEAARPVVIAASRQPRPVPPSQDPTVARFVLAGRPRPPITQSLRMAELFRTAVLSRFGWDQDVGTGRWRPKAPPMISGKDHMGHPLRDGHTHASWLPEDADGDGLIDHLCLVIPGGMSADILQVLAQLDKLFVAPKRPQNGDEHDGDRGREEWHLALEGVGEVDAFAGASRLFGASRRWTSMTPMLAAGHLKRPGLEGYKREVRRLLIRRGWFGEHEALDVAVTAGHPPHPNLRPLHFDRFRARGREAQPDTHGAFLTLGHLEEPGFQGDLMCGALLGVTGAG